MQLDSTKRKNGAHKGISKSMMRAIVGFVEIAILSITYYVGWRHGYASSVFPDYLVRGKYVLMGVYALLLWVLFHNTEGFMYGNLRKFELSLAQWIALVIANIITYFQLCLIANAMVTPLPMVAITFANLLFAFLMVCLSSAVFHKFYRPHNMVMVYGTNNALTMKLKMDTRRDKYYVKKLISADEDIEKIYREILNYDAVLLNDITAEIRNDLLKFCYEYGVAVYAVPKISDVIIRGAEDIQLFDTPIILVKGSGLSRAQRFVKRVVDIILSGIGLLVTWPILLVIAIAIKLEDGGPVFYRQRRATIDYREFDILKFRSMIVDAEKMGESIPATGKDPRITKVGHVIRAIRVDELPQLINILKGDMSVVGPRPERLEHVRKYAEEVPEFGYRLKVKGGLTGYAQVYGKYNTSPYDKIRLDLMYIEHYSIWLDIKLILITLRILFQKESTEGFDVAEENERRKEEMLKEIHHENEEE
ncbi:MAG: sugar transferase [Clostridia bacterium]|nr:sugar transferase [Clostridia bacterium]